MARDPSFFKAYCLLASTHDRLYFLGANILPRAALAEAAIREAFRLRPEGEKPTWHARKTCIEAIDYDAALAELKSLPKPCLMMPGVFELKGYIERRRGKQERRSVAWSALLIWIHGIALHAPAACAYLS